MLLNGWKEIANYIGKRVPTIQRWERYGLPVRRQDGDKETPAVVATTEEIEDWILRPPRQELRDSRDRQLLETRLSLLRAEAQRMEKLLASTHE
jgi:phage terminase Nu1 subunit (DNA packaging protein)